MNLLASHTRTYLNMISTTVTGVQANIKRYTFSDIFRSVNYFYSRFR